MEIRRARGHVHSHGESIFFEDAGSGEAVVLAHGAGVNHAVWFQQVPVLARSFRVIAWDHRGSGASTATTGHVGAEAAVEDTLAILDHLEIDRAHVIGHSMGAWGTLAFALAHPGRTRSVVLAGSVAGIVTPAMEDWWTSFSAHLVATPRPGASQPAVLGRSPATGTLESDDPARAYLYQLLGNFNGPPPPPEAVRRLISHRIPAGTLAAVPLPVLFVAGADDPIYPAAMIRAAAAAIPGATVTELAGAGHSPHFESPDAFNETVTGFLRGTG